MCSLWGWVQNGKSTLDIVRVVDTRGDFSVSSARVDADLAAAIYSDRILILRDQVIKTMLEGLDTVVDFIMENGGLNA